MFMDTDLNHTQINVVGKILLSLLQPVIDSPFKKGGLLFFEDM